MFDEFESPADVHNGPPESVDLEDVNGSLVKGTDASLAPEKLNKYRDTLLHFMNGKPGENGKLNVTEMRTLVDTINAGYDGGPLTLKKSMRKADISAKIFEHFPITVIGHFIHKEAYKQATTTSPGVGEKKRNKVPFNIITVCLKKWFMPRVSSTSMKLGSKNEANVFKHLPSVLLSNGSNLNVIAGKEYGLIRHHKLESMVASIDGMLLTTVYTEADSNPRAIPIEIKTKTTHKTQLAAKARIGSRKYVHISKFFHFTNIYTH